jgi:hypothetical protein
LERLRFPSLISRFILVILLPIYICLIWQVFAGNFHIILYFARNNNYPFKCYYNTAANAHYPTLYPPITSPSPVSTGWKTPNLYSRTILTLQRLQMKSDKLPSVTFNRNQSIWKMPKNKVLSNFVISFYAIQN